MIIGLLIGLALAAGMWWAARRIDDAIGREDTFWRDYDD